jgi:hypothetical protein
MAGYTLKNLLKRILARKIAVQDGDNRKKVRYKTIPASERLITGIIFAITALTGLIILETTHLIILKTWNSEIFAAITSIIGTILGVFISQKA